MISTINRLTQHYEKKHGHRPNLLYVNTQQLDVLKGQLCEKKIDVISQLIGMEIIIVQDIQESYVSWVQISWKHKSRA